MYHQLAHVHKFGPFEQARFTGEPVRRCNTCRVVSLDADEQGE